MKTVGAQLVTICVGVMFMSLIPATHAKVTVEDAIGIWLLDENQGKVVRDSSGNGHDGDIQGPKWEKGQIGSALSFNGQIDRVVIADADSLYASDEWSVTAWIYVNKSETGYGHILGKRSGAGTNYAFRTSSTGTGWESYFRRDNAWQGAWQQGNVQKDVWLYMTAVYDGKNTITIYENGEEIGSAPVGAPPPRDTAELHLGGWEGNTSELLDGLLDEIVLFNVALTEDDINDLMDRGTERALGILPVEAKAKLATTWATVKATR